MLERVLIFSTLVLFVGQIQLSGTGGKLGT
jgi:hypothetical protein